MSNDSNITNITDSNITDSTGLFLSWKNVMDLKKAGYNVDDLKEVEQKKWDGMLKNVFEIVCPERINKIYDLPPNKVLKFFINIITNSFGDKEAEKN